MCLSFQDVLGRSSIALSVAFCTAPIIAPLTPLSSISLSPCIVVPPGEATAVLTYSVVQNPKVADPKLTSRGCNPLSMTSFAVL